MQAIVMCACQHRADTYFVTSDGLDCGSGEIRASDGIRIYVSKEDQLVRATITNYGKNIHGALMLHCVV